MLQRNRISTGWYDKFMKRQTYLSLCKGDPGANDRMDAVTSQAIKHYFNSLEKTLKDKQICSNLQCQSNWDGLRTPSAKGSLSKGAKKVKSCTSGNKAQTTVVLGLC